MKVGGLAWGSTLHVCDVCGGALYATVGYKGQLSEYRYCLDPACPESYQRMLRRLDLGVGDADA